MLPADPALAVCHVLPTDAMRPVVLPRLSRWRRDGKDIRQPRTAHAASETSGRIARPLAPPGAQGGTRQAAARLVALTSRLFALTDGLAAGDRTRERAAETCRAARPARAHAAARRPTRRRRC